ncbi:hypothetical protein EYA84_25340 [Verrucosispora sp. SN26_14.1]|uniref:hypothetical protein n=1 Tax=Verrucosispora sp. SN26_14.1 TaxID=2527879 RepID=UPI0010339E2E|nr:hypothetical protein [Verrucosispora sp. SN26_14.1]TBL29078.1 hypothetical protein EYA84_25340 [Verrucosispora sp. SN26_14.1]
MAARRYAIEVNEGVVESSRQGADWWFARRQMFVASGRLREVKAACITGGVVRIGDYDEDDATFMADHMVASGMPQSAVRVKAVTS